MYVCNIKQCNVMLSNVVYVTLFTSIYVLMCVCNFN